MIILPRATFLGQTLPITSAVPLLGRSERSGAKGDFFLLFWGQAFIDPEYLLANFAGRGNLRDLLAAKSGLLGAGTAGTIGAWECIGGIGVTG